jgi:hypothetical protein
MDSGFKFSGKKKKTEDKPSMYKDSKLFHPHGSQDIRKTDTVPDPQLESIEPEDKEETLSSTAKALAILDELSQTLEKAGVSAGRNINPSEKQAKREYSHSYARRTGGITGVTTPDLPERGRDWHGTVPGVPDEPESPPDDGEEQEEAEAYFKDPENPLKSATKGLEAMQEAMKALAGAPVLPKGPLIPPTARTFLLEHGYTPAEIEAGVATMTPRMRGMYNRDLLSAVKKSLSGLESIKD